MSWASTAYTGGPDDGPVSSISDPGGPEDGRGELPVPFSNGVGAPGDGVAAAVTERAGHTERPSPVAPEGAPSGVAQPGLTGRAAAMLPVALRNGRLDPGRRGAAALVLAVVLAAVVAGAVVLRGRPQEVLVPQVLSSGSPLPGASAATDPQAQVVVSVSGKVVRPGLVRLPAGSRVDDALRAAGGPAPGATTGLLNLARRLVDGEQVLVGVDPAPGPPAAGAGAGAGPGSSSGAGTGGLLDLNTATATDLDALPGIGPVLAQRIVDWRTEHQRFASVDQLREVTGIGEAKYEDLKAKVIV